VALPSSRATPVEACPALRPRWCPGRIAFTRLGLLPSAPLHGVGFPSGFNQGYPADHPYTHFGAPSRGLYLRYPRLHTSLHKDARGFATARLDRLWAGGTSIQLDSHPLGNYDPFHGSIFMSPFPRSRASLGTSSGGLGRAQPTPTPAES